MSRDTSKENGGHGDDVVASDSPIRPQRDEATENPSEKTSDTMTSDAQATGGDRTAASSGKTVSPAKPAPLIEDVAPQKVRDRTDLMHLVLAALIGVAATLIAYYLTGLTSGVQSDMERAVEGASWLLSMPFTFFTQLCTVVIIGWVIIQTVITKEWVQCLSSATALILGYLICDLISWLVVRTGNPELITALISNNNISGTLLPDLYAGLAAFLTAAGPMRMRNSVRWGWIITDVLTALLVIVSFESPAGTIVSYTLGRAIGLTTRFIAGSPSFGAWGSQITDAMAMIGLKPVRLVRRAEQDGTADIADGLVPDSRIYDMTCADGTSYVVSVSDEQRHATGYLRQLWQMITLTGISHRTDRSARAAVRHHRNMLLDLRHIGLPQLNPYEVTYSKESAILVLTKDEVLSPCDWSTVTDNDVADVMAYLHRANTRGYTNRTIRPGSFARTKDGRLILTGWDIGDDGSNGANIAIDRVQMLAALMCTIGIDRTILCGIRAWGREEMAALQPYVQSAVIPMETVRMQTWDRRHSIKTLRTRLGQLVDEDEAEQTVPVTVTRFSLRTILSIMLVLIAAIVIFTQFNLDEMITAVTGANTAMALLCFLFGCLAWVGMTITLTAFTEPDKRHFFAAFMAQITTSFTAVSMPAGVGPAFVNLQFLRKTGHRNSKATAIMSAVIAVQVVATVILIVFVGLFTGRASFGSMVPTGTVAIVIAALIVVGSLCMLIRPLRTMIQKRLMPILSQYAHQLAALLTQPATLAVACFGAVLQSVALGLSFWAALMAFGYHSNVVETTFIYLLSSTIGSAVPTPGGLGGVEAMLFAAFTGTGVPGAIAMSATMLFRVLTYWIRIPMGALSMKWLQKRNML